MISSFVRALVSRGPRIEAGATAAQRASTFWSRCGPGLDPGFRSGAWHPVPSINSSLHEIGELVLVYLTPECRRLRLGRLRNAT